MNTGEQLLVDNIVSVSDSNRIDPTRPLPELLEHFREHQADKIALIEGELSRSWADSVQRIYRMANGLLALGLEPGDRVAMLSCNSMSYSEFFIATLIAGGCAVPLQSMVTDLTLGKMLEDSNAKVLVVSEAMFTQVEGFLSEQTQLLAGGLLGFDFGGHRSTHHITELDPWLSAQTDSAPGLDLNPEAPFNIIYSSGTTGLPKGIIHNHTARLGLLKELIKIGLGGDVVNLVSTPMYSNTTITTWWPSLSHGATQVIMPKFDAEQALRLIQQHGVTHAILVPVQYDRIMQLTSFDDFDLSSMRIKFSTSAPLRKALKADIIERFPGELIEFYGMTEGGASTIFVGSVAIKKGKLDSVGPPITGHKLKVIDDQGNELPQGEIGEIVGRSQVMSDGYHNRDKATQELCWYDQEGVLYYRTGDVGYVDEERWLFLLDRRKDMIISGGFNIYATDLERVLVEHPGVHEVAVVAIPSSKWGETPLAIVATKAGVDVDAEALRCWANAQLGKMQSIGQLVFTDNLPRNSIGKILKKQLRETYSVLADQN